MLINTIVRTTRSIDKFNSFFLPFIFRISISFSFSFTFKDGIPHCVTDSNFVPRYSMHKRKYDIQIFQNKDPWFLYDCQNPITWSTSEGENPCYYSEGWHRALINKSNRRSAKYLCHFNISFLQNVEFNTGFSITQVHTESQFFFNVQRSLSSVDSSSLVRPSVTHATSNLITSGCWSGVPTSGLGCS